MNQLINITQNENNDQVVSGRELHEFLGVKTPYHIWFERMTEYGFTENVDFIGFEQKSSKLGGRPSQDHALKLDMAKEISMIQRTAKGKEARQYFIQVEKEYKQQQLPHPDVSNLSPELQMFNQMFQAVANQEQKLVEVNDKVDNISNIVALNVTDWRKESQKIIRAIGYKIGGGTAYQEISKEIYTEVDRRAGSSLKTRLTNMRRVMAEEGVSKSKRNGLNYLDVIDKDKRLKEIYIAVVKDFAIKYQVEVA